MLKTPSRLRSLDSLRGLASILVFFHHDLSASGLLTGSLSDFIRSTPLQPLRTGRAGVLFFFVLSGFVLTLSLQRLPALKLQPWALWALQRSIRLCVPAAASLVLSAILYRLTYSGAWPGEAWLLTVTWMAPLTFQAWLDAGLLVNGGGYGGFTANSVLWSLVHELRISLLLPLTGLTRFAGRNGAALMLIGSIAVYSIVSGSLGSNLGGGEGAGESWRTTVYFILPFAAGSALAKLLPPALPRAPALVVAALIAVLGLMQRDGGDTESIIASMLLIWAALTPGRFQAALCHPTLVWLGSISFSLYLVHLPIIAALQHRLHAELNVWTIFALAVPAALGGAALFYVAVERPSRWLARWVVRKIEPRTSSEEVRSFAP